MLDLILWLLTVSAVGLAALPLLYVAFPSLLDRAFGFARPLGILVVGALVWMLSLLRIVPNVGWSWWLIAVLIGVGGWCFIYIRCRVEFLRFVKRRWLHLLITEVVFLVFFLAFTLYRMNDPDISATEEPMDLTMLNAVMVDSYAPPDDLWLSDYPISYYYFGYWMFGGIAQMSGVAAEVAFNLSGALIAGMAAAGIYSLTTNLIRRDGGSMGIGIASGFMACVLLLVTSNLNGMWELLSLSGIGSDGFYNWLGIDGVDKNDPGGGWRPSGFWWWWASSRVINTFDVSNGSVQSLDFTIQEFPFFSFLLGDLHPHVMSIPFVLLGVSMISNVYFSPIRWGFGWLLRNRVAALLLMLMLGASGFINAWDIALMVMLFMAAVYMKSYRENGYSVIRAVRVALAPSVLLLLFAAVFYFNYYFVTLRSQVQYPPIVPVQYGTRPIHFLTVWAGLISFAFVFVAAYVGPNVMREFKRVRGFADEGRHPLLRLGLTPWVISILITGGAYLLWALTHYASGRFVDGTDIYMRLVVAGPLGLAFIGLFVTTYNRGVRGADDGVQLILLVATYAVLLLFGAELFFVHDFFGSRMNTVFKFYYQSWIVLSVVGGYGVFHWWRVHPSFRGYKRVLSGVVASLAAMLFLMSLYYPVAASATKSAESGTRVTLDGLAFMDEQSPDVRDALIWIRDNVDEDEVLMEGVGGSYSEFGRYSGFTGAQSVIGWTGHENQWRGSNEFSSRRSLDVNSAYSGSDEDLSRTVELYGVDYIVVGPAERRKYTDLNETKFESIAGRAYENGQVTIYKLRK